MKTIFMKPRQWIKRALLVLTLGFISIVSFAQDPTDSIPPDPGAISVYTIQNLSFGAFSHGNTGGTVIISNSGIRSVTGDVIPLNLGFPYFQAIFELDAPEGTIISILNGADATLTGSNGGSITLRIGNSDPASPFITTVPQPVRTQVSIGGTLTIGSPVANPPGTYTGTFYITFNQE
jgi:Domain of unknown function (DUF4402)